MEKSDQKNKTTKHKGNHEKASSLHMSIGQKYCVKRHSFSRFIASLCSLIKVININNNTRP